MNKMVLSSTAETFALVRIAALMAAGLLGLFIVGVSGFAHMEVLHNAAHDYRHSMAFPCH